MLEGFAEEGVGVCAMWDEDEVLRSVVDRVGDGGGAEDVGACGHGEGYLAHAEDAECAFEGGEGGGRDGTVAYSIEDEHVRI